MTERQASGPDEPGPSVVPPGIYYPTGRPHAGYELDTNGVARIFNSYDIDAAAHPVSVLIASRALDTLSKEQGVQIGAFVSSDGLLIQGGDVELYMPHGVIIRDITPEDFRLRQRQLRHELGHLIWHVLHKDKEDAPYRSLYDRQPLVNMVRKAGQISTPLNMLELLANTASHNPIQQIGGILLTGMSALAWTDPKVVLWHLDKEERFANRVARRHWRVPLLKPKTHR
jgi:hypothetical protein